MSKNISVSVVIPAYNAADSVLEALSSILRQTRFDAIKEIVVIDDGSKDDTLNAVTHFIQTNNHPGTSKIRIFSQKNSGVSKARNVGIEATSGDWIAFLDADDTWLEKKIELSIQAIAQYPEIHALGTNNTKIKRCHGKKVEDGLRKLTLRKILWKSWPQTPTLMLSRDILHKVHGFDIHRSHAEDLDLLLRIAAHTQVYYLETPLAVLADKPIYGARGLSADIRKMHLGCIENIHQARLRGDILYIEYLLFCCWENVKYLRRNIFTKLRKA